MRQRAVPINAMTQLIHDVCRQLSSLEVLDLSQDALESVRLIQLERLARQIETALPGHFGHGERTAYYALLLADEIALNARPRLDVQYAALLHDIGLLTLPGHLLEDTAAHSLNDYALIQSHPREGAALLAPFSFLNEPARLIAHHHERWDGAGYPYGLRGSYIPIGARILALADVFDTIAARSSSWHTALRALHASAGSQFDPDLCATFCAVLQDRSTRSRPDAETPVGSSAAPASEPALSSTADSRPF